MIRQLQMICNWRIMVFMTPHRNRTLPKVLKKSYFELFLHGKGKVTEARIHVLSALSNVHKPLSIKAIAKLVKEHNISTFYRTLETLVKIGLVKKISINSGESLYETTIDRQHHHHITCTSCGLLEDIDICIKKPSHSEIAGKGFSSITDHSLEFFGICKTCAKS